MAQQFVMGQLKVRVGWSVRGQGLRWGAHRVHTAQPHAECPFLAPTPPQGFSAHWWNFRHFQHHAKPNVFYKDPDGTAVPVFLLGELSVEVRGEDVDALRLVLQLRGDW